MTEQDLYIQLADLTYQLTSCGEDAALLFERAKVYLELNDKARALDDLDAAIEADSTFAQAFLLRGQLRYELKDKASAWDDLRQAAQLDPELLSSVSGEFKTPKTPKTFKF